MKDKGVWVYDLEQFKNFHSIAAVNYHTGEEVFYCIHYQNGKLTRNDLVEYYKFLNQRCNLMIGFNNLNYDYPLLHYILYKAPYWVSMNSTDILSSLYDKSQEIINSQYSAIRERNVKIPQLDLYKLNHFDNKAKAVGLKWIQFAMNWKRLQDLPYQHYEHIDEKDINSVKDYNFNDVYSTHEFAKKCMNDITMRQSLTKKYGINLMNANAPKIGSEIFASILSKELDIPIYDLKKMRTHRDVINLKECILESIEFKSNHFKELLKFLKSQSITETKGFFSSIPLNKIKPLIPYVSPVTVNKKTKKLEKLNILYKGLQFDFGTGGLHGCQPPGIYEADDKYMIVDIDVASFYPNLAIQNKFYPEHLTEKFCEIYSSIYHIRSLAKKKAKSGDKMAAAENEGLKLALNGSYGKSNDEYSFFYDPKFTMAITMNGQLLLTMLAESILDTFSDCTVLQVNTDGLTVKIRRDQYEELIKICKNWEEFTNLELEYVEYKSMIIRDVNNYIGVYTDINKSPKLKGTFEIIKAYHKNHSMRIVSIALMDYFTKGIPIEKTIRDHKDIYDFCLGEKTSRGWYMVLRHIKDGEYQEEHLQKTNRYYISNNVKKVGLTGTLMKVHEDGRETNVQKGYKSTLFNDYFEAEDYDINYEYYIRECNKIINTITNNFQTTLF